MLSGSSLSNIRFLTQDLLRLGMAGAVGYANRNINRIQLDYITNPYGRQPPHILIFRDGRFEPMTPFQLPVPGYGADVLAIELLGINGEPPSAEQEEAVRLFGKEVRKLLQGGVGFTGHKELVALATGMKKAQGFQDVEGYEEEDNDDEEEDGQEQDSQEQDSQGEDHGYEEKSVKMAGKGGSQAGSSVGQPRAKGAAVQAAQPENSPVFRQKAKTDSSPSDLSPSDSSPPEFMRHEDLRMAPVRRNDSSMLDVRLSAPPPLHPDQKGQFGWQNHQGQNHQGHDRQGQNHHFVQKIATINEVFDILGTAPERRVPLPPGSLFNTYSNAEAGTRPLRLGVQYTPAGTREVTSLVVVPSHDSTKPEPQDAKEYTLDDLRRVDQQAGMDDFRAHYLLTKDGVLVPARSLEIPGNCWPGRNDSAIQIVLAGNGNSPTPSQRRTLYEYGFAMREHYAPRPTRAFVRNVEFAMGLLGIDPTGQMRDNLANPSLIDAPLPDHAQKKPRRA